MNPHLVQAALAVSDFPLLLLLVKATVVASASLLLVRTASRARASVRHAVMATAFGVLAALPLTAIPAPTPTIEIPMAVTPAAPADAWVAALAPFDRQILPAATVDPNAGAALDWQQVVLLVWAAGALCCLAPVLLGLYQLHRYRRLGVPMPRAAAALAATAEGLALRRPLTLLCHGSIAGPMTYGVRHPVVLLPADVCGWDDPSIRRALIHELEHVRRRDWLAHCGSRIVCAAYWFHPMVWVMRRRLVLEAERACDDAVLQQADPAQYADQLVDLAERFSQTEHRPVLAMAGRDDLTTRIEAVLNPFERRGRAGLMGAIAAAAIALLAFTVAPLRATSLPLPATAPAPMAFISRFLPPPPPDPSTMALASPQGAQAPPAAEAPRLTFAVASVKINRLGPRAGGAAPMGGTGAPPSVGGRFVRTNIPIDVLIAQAYGPLQRFEIAGVPEWATDTRVDVEARADGNPTAAEMNQMLQALLADRFGLVVRRETREQPVYALVVARTGALGPRLTAHADNSGCVDPQTTPNNVRGLDPNAPLPPPPCGAFRGAPAIGRLAGADVPLDLLGRAVSGQLGRMVLDRTGLAGTFDFILEWTPLQQLPGVDPVAIANPDRPSIFTAFDEQLGLKLEAQTGPVNMLVIERVEMPTEN